MSNHCGHGRMFCMECHTQSADPFTAPQKAQPQPDVEQMKRELEGLRESRLKDLVEIQNLRATLAQATDRIKDMLMGDDGQAWKEAEKFLKGLEVAQPSGQKAN